MIVLYTEVDAQCNKLHGEARRSNDVDRRKCCQLSSTDIGRYFIAVKRPCLCRTVRCPARCDDRPAAATCFYVQSLRARSEIF